MFTKEQLLQIIADVPNEFSIEDLLAILNRPRLEQPVAATLATRPANLTPAEIADWERYTSPEALALYAMFTTTKIARLHGIAAGLSPADLQKSAKEWEAARIRDKYGI